MQNEQILSVLEDAVKQLPDCHEKVVLLTMCGNLYAGASNAPIADVAINVAKQMLAELKDMR